MLPPPAVQLSAGGARADPGFIPAAPFLQNACLDCRTYGTCAVEGLAQLKFGATLWQKT